MYSWSKLQITQGYTTNYKTGAKHRASKNLNGIFCMLPKKRPCSKPPPGPKFKPPDPALSPKPGSVEATLALL